MTRKQQQQQQQRQNSNIHMFQSRIFTRNFQKIMLLSVISSFFLLNCFNFNSSWETQPTNHRVHNFPVKSAYDSTAFLSLWNTEETSAGSSGNAQIRLPLLSNGIYDFKVDWGDGTNNTILNTNYTSAIHTYSSGGIYDLNITGLIIGWQFDNGGDRLKLLEIQQWGCLQLGNSGGYFHGCENFKFITNDILNLTGTTNLTRAFRDCINSGKPYNMNGWDVSSVTDMSWMFYNSSFNSYIWDWNVSSVTNMSAMFSYSSCSSNIGDWDVSSVTDMSHMFSYSSLIQDIEDWDVSSVTDMSHMFDNVYIFNQPLGNWNVSSVINMSSMFSHSSFNQDIKDWNVSHVLDMSHMFAYAQTFNHPLEDWDVSRVTNMSFMFIFAESFNQPLGEWEIDKNFN